MNESAALSEGHNDEEREARLARESAASSKGHKDGREDEEEREASKLAILTEGCDTWDNFLGAVKEADASEWAGLWGASRACIDFSCAKSLVGLVIVMGNGD